MCKHYVFVASAGAYKADNIEPMHFEGDVRKGSAGGMLQAATAAARQQQRWRQRHELQHTTHTALVGWLPD